MLKRLLFVMSFFVCGLSAIIDSPVSFSVLRDECFGRLAEFDFPFSNGLSYEFSAFVSFQELLRATKSAKSAIVEQMRKPINWAEKAVPTSPVPFMQKLIVNTKSFLYIQGDIHGSIHSLLRNLDRLKDVGYLSDDFKLSPAAYLFFLGDYGDRGRYSAEVFYILFRLKEANPTQVFLLRGNHEAVGMADVYGLSKELREKYGEEAGMAYLNEELGCFFNHMPTALFVGAGDIDQTNYMLLCHGLPSFGYNIQSFLNTNRHAEGYRFGRLDFNESLRKSQLSVFDSLDRALIEKAYQKKYQNTGFVHWSEFIWGDVAALVEYRPHRSSLSFTLNILLKLLDIYSSLEDGHIVRALFRGHQHSDGNGCYDKYVAHVGTLPWTFKLYHALCSGLPIQLAAGSIYTLISAPEGIGNRVDVDFDSFVIVETSKFFYNWIVCPYEFSLPAHRAILVDDKWCGSMVSKKDGIYHWTPEKLLSKKHQLVDLTDEEKKTADCLILIKKRKGMTE